MKTIIDWIPKPGEVVTIMNQPGTPQLQSLAQMYLPAFRSVIDDGQWLGTDIHEQTVAKFERIYSAAATQIHAGLWDGAQ